MPVQAQSDNTTVPFIRFANPGAVKGDTVIQQDAARAAILTRLTVMGFSLSAVPTTGTADVGNTGDGTVTAVAQLSQGPVARVGAYNLEVTAAVANGGVLKLEGPGGELIADGLVMTAGAGAATVFNAGGMTFTVTDGAADFIVGDKFAITVTAVNKYNPLNGAAVDGSQRVAGIYFGDDIAIADLVAGDIVDSLVILGDVYVDLNQLVFENSLALTSVLPSGKTVEQELIDLGIFAEDTIDISGYEA
jgi:hypothetical protein